MSSRTLNQSEVVEDVYREHEAHEIDRADGNDRASQKKPEDDKSDWASS